MEELGNYSANTLTLAATKIYKTREYSTFPTIAEIRKAIETVLADSVPMVSYHPNEIDWEKTKFRSFVDEHGVTRWIRPSWKEKQKAAQVRENARQD